MKFSILIKPVINASENWILVGEYPDLEAACYVLRDFTNGKLSCKVKLEILPKIETEVHRY